jgi:hypothetical protein
VQQDAMRISTEAARVADAELLKHQDMTEAKFLSQLKMHPKTFARDVFGSNFWKQKKKGVILREEQILAFLDGVGLAPEMGVIILFGIYLFIWGISSTKNFLSISGKNFPRVEIFFSRNNSAWISDIDWYTKFLSVINY